MASVWQNNMESIKTRMKRGLSLDGACDVTLVLECNNVHIQKPIILDVYI